MPCWRGFNMFPNSSVTDTDGDISVTIPQGRIYGPSQVVADCLAGELAESSLFVAVCGTTPPVADFQEIDVVYQTPTLITLTGSGTGDLIYTIVTQPLFGALEGSGNTYTYTPPEGFEGFDYFGFNVSGGTGTSENALVTLNVLGPQVFVADYITVQYQFEDGLDLDTRTSILYPMSGNEVGWCQDSTYYGPNGDLWYEWAGDNTGSGYESVLIYVANIRADFPGALIEGICRAWWYNLRESGQVTLALTAYEGGVMDFVPGEYRWVNVGGVETAALTQSATIDLNISECVVVAECVSGFTYTDANEFAWISCP